MGDDIANRFMVTAINTFYGVELTLQSHGQYDLDALLAMLGQIVTLEPVSEARRG